MKLVLYENMPNSPLPPPSSAHRVSQWVSQGRDLASRASDRASLRVRRKISKQSIGAPFVDFEDQEPIVRRMNFRPLELSIYLPGSRLSDLPEFADVDFTDCGEIQMPPKAFMRPQSEANVRSLSNSQPRPAISMIGERQLECWQQRQGSSAQRPPSACEGLSSHPTQWDSLPGLSRQAVAVRSQSRSSETRDSGLLSRSADSVALHFPPVEEEAEEAEEEDEEEMEKVKLVEHCPIRQSSDNASGPAPPLSTRASYKGPMRPAPARFDTLHRNRISQWLSRSSSRSSFSLATNQAAVVSDLQNSLIYQTGIAPAPLPQQPQLPHARSTSSSSIFSSPAPSLTSMTSMTTAPTVYTSRSRAGTVRSLGKQFTVVDEEEVDQWEHDSDLPDVPGIPATFHARTHARCPGHSDFDFASPLSFSGGRIQESKMGPYSKSVSVPVPVPTLMPVEPARSH
jgi:hypothetical protein